MCLLILIGRRLDQSKEKRCCIRLQFSRYISLAQWLSWLERCPVTAEVAGSSPAWVVNIFGYYLWGLSSAGRASALQAEGHRFEPCRSHSSLKKDGIDIILVI